MKDYFSIGEISKLTGLSDHALRYYDKIHLVTPAIVNEQNEYRYYSYLQLFTLDWVRYLQTIGFSLDEIRDILSDVSAGTLIRSLAGKQAELDAEIERLQTLRDSLDSKAPTANFRDFLMGEVRYSSLYRKFPEIADQLFAKAQRDAEERTENYLRLTGK